MATYTNLGIKKITTGDESGTWGTSTNTNFDYFDTAIVGYVAVTLPSAGSSGTPNTINVADFSVSDGRNRVVEFVDAGDLGATAYVQITPNDFEGYYFIQNSLSGNRSILLFQGTYDAGRDYEIPNGKDVVVRCTGGGSTSYIYNILDNLQVNSIKASLAESTGLPVSTGISGLGTGVATALAVNTGSAGAVVVNGGALGTPSSGILTNATGLPVSTGISGLGTGVATFLATPSSANLAAAVTDETGSGALVFNTIPTLDRVLIRYGTGSSACGVVSPDSTDTIPIRTSFYDQIALSSLVTNQHISFLSNPSTVAASFTLDNHYGFFANGISKGAGSTVTTQYGFYSRSLITGATTNYGFYSGLAASGTSRYNFYAAGTAPNYFGGNTVISVNDNTNAALRVTQVGTANALEIEDSANPDATPFIVNNGGQLVIGNTAAVSTKLETAASTPSVQLHGTLQQTSAYGAYGYSSSAALAGFYSFHKSKSGTVGTLSTVTDGDVLGTIQWNGADNDATSTFNPAAYIQAACAGTVGTTSVPGRLTFWTTAVSGTSPTQRATITQEGYVGIGATPNSAAQLLDLRGTNNALTSDTAVNTLRFTDTDTTTAANQPIGKIEFYNSDTDNAAVGAYILSSAVGTSGGGTIRFGAAANAGAVAEIARVASTGLTVTADTAGLGYGTGTGGAVTQATSRTTGVTLNKTNGAITLVSAAGSATWQSFTVTNSTVAATDVVVLSQKSGTDLYMLEVTAVAAGSFRISFATTGGTTTEQPVFNFAVIKAVAA